MACATALVIRAAAEPLRILCFREIQESIDESVKAIIEQRIRDCGLDGFFKITKQDITAPNGSKFIFRGLSDLTAASIKSLNDIDIAWGEEAQALSKVSLDLFLPTIRKDTSEIWFSMNPELDTDPVYTTFIQKRPTNARIIEVNWDKNPFWNAAMEAERQRSMADDPDDYDHIWEGVPKSSMAGAIYRREMHTIVTNNRIRPLLPDPTMTLHAIFDLGISETDLMTVNIAQADISGARILDYHEDNGYGIEHYLGWIKDSGYKDVTIWLPHDGNNRSVQTGITTKKVVELLGWQVEIVPSIGLEPGIKMTRNMLKNVFISDSPQCEQLVEHLRRYTRAKSGHPKHDMHSHCADGVRYLSIAMVHFKNVSERKRHTAELARNVRIIPTVNHWAKV
jgi:phage terminase large subunit